MLERQCSVRFLRVFYAQYWKSAPNPSVCRRQSEEQDPCLVALQGAGCLAGTPELTLYHMIWYHFCSRFPVPRPSSVALSPLQTHNPSTLFPLDDFADLLGICKKVTSITYAIVSNSVKLLPPFVIYVISHFCHFSCSYLILPAERYLFLILCS